NIAITDKKPGTNMVCERPPAGRFAPRLSPFVRGTLAAAGGGSPKTSKLQRAACGGSTNKNVGPLKAVVPLVSVPLAKGDRRGAKRPAGGRSQAMSLIECRILESLALQSIGFAV